MLVQRGSPVATVALSEGNLRIKKNTHAFFEKLEARI
jgi:hypothetical protein